MVRSRIALPHSTAIVSPIRTSSISGIGISSYVFDEDIGRAHREGLDGPGRGSGDLFKTEFVGVGTGGGADQGLDGASLGAGGAIGGGVGDHALDLERVVAFTY